MRSSGSLTPRAAYFISMPRTSSPTWSVLIGGPANAKHELCKHNQRHAPPLVPPIAAAESLDHPTDRELVAHARHFFRAADCRATQRSCV
jgi:hypothetical protein